jgi:uncharacterized protein (DUF2062 family)
MRKNPRLSEPQEHSLSVNIPWFILLREGRMTNGLLSRKLIRPLLELLRQGVTPEKLALSIALGAVLGVLPAIGCNTALCALIALILRLNLPAIQIVNYFLYPLQIVLLVPFFRLGEKMFRAGHLPVSVAQIHEMAHRNLWGSIRLLWTATWHATVAWFLFAPVTAALIYFLLLPALRHVLKQVRATSSSAGAQVTG